MFAADNLKMVSYISKLLVYIHVFFEKTNETKAPSTNLFIYATEFSSLKKKHFLSINLHAFGRLLNLSGLSYFPAITTKKTKLCPKTLIRDTVNSLITLSLTNVEQTSYRKSCRSGVSKLQPAGQIRPANTFYPACGALFKKHIHPL